MVDVESPDKHLLELQHRNNKIDKATRHVLLESVETEAIPEQNQNNSTSTNSQKARHSVQINCYKGESCDSETDNVLSEVNFLSIRISWHSTLCLFPLLFKQHFGISTNQRAAEMHVTQDQPIRVQHRSVYQQLCRVYTWDAGGERLRLTSNSIKHCPGRDREKTSCTSIASNGTLTCSIFRDSILERAFLQNTWEFVWWIGLVVTSCITNSLIHLVFL